MNKVETNQNSNTFWPFLFAGRRPFVFQSLLVLLPILIQVFLIARNFRTWVPVWASYPDPGYSYVLAGASLISGGTPALVYHPGTSFQWLVGILERLTFALVGEQTFFLDVVTRSEYYAQSVGLGIAILYVLSLGAVAWRIMKFWGWLPSFIFQLMILWGLPVIASARHHLWPESLVLITSLFTVALLAPLMAGHNSELRVRTIAILGAFAAIGVMSKVIFVPMMLLTVALVPAKRLWILALTFSASIGLLVLSIRSRISFMWDWFAGVTLSTGRHGGESQASALENLIIGQTVLSGFLRWYWLLMLILVAGTLILGLLQVRSGVLPLRPSIALLAALGLTLALSLKQSQPRDLIVVVPILASLAAHLMFRVDTVARQSRTSPILVSFIAATFGFLALHGIVHQHNFFKHSSIQSSRIVANAAQVDFFIKEGAWGLGYNVWTPSNALMFGSNDAVMFGAQFSDEMLDKELKAVHSDPLYFDVWHAEFQRISEEGRLSIMACSDVYDLFAQSNGEVGVIVESTNHIRFDSTRSRIGLAGGQAEFSGPLAIGDYFAYRFDSLNCDE